MPSAELCEAGSTPSRPQCQTALANPHSSFFSAHDPLVGNEYPWGGTEAEIDIETFAARAKAELGSDPVLVSGPDIAVWATKP